MIINTPTDGNKWGSNNEGIGKCSGDFAPFWKGFVFQQGSIQSLVQGACFHDLDPFRPWITLAEALGDNGGLESQLGSFPQADGHLSRHAQFSGQSNFPYQHSVSFDRNILDGGCQCS